MRDMRTIRALVAFLALLLGAYCFLAAATDLSAQPDPGHPNPAELAARERYRWPGWIPITFLGLVVLYAAGAAARRRRRVGERPTPGPPSTQDPPPIARPAGNERRDSASR